MAIKNARKQSQDPVQEHLRNHKDKWNAAASELISKLIAFKRGLNGRGDSDYQLPISSIKDPLPLEVGSFLNSLSTDFQSLVSDAGQIIQEQGSYSKGRRKKQISASYVVEEILVVEASNPFTRAFSKLTSIFKRDKYKNDRVALLELSSELYKELVSMQDLIVSRNLTYEDLFKKDGNIKNSLKKIQDQFKILHQKISEDKSLEKEVANTNVENTIINNDHSSSAGIDQTLGKPNPPISFESLNDLSEDDIDMDLDEAINQINKYVPEIRKILNVGLQDISKLQEIHHQWKKSKTPVQKETSKDRFIESYRDFLDVIKLRIKNKNVSFNNSDNIEEVLVSSGLIQKKAGNPISRFIGKQILTGPSKPVKIDIFEKIGSIKKEVNSISDDLESASASYDAIYIKFAKVYNDYLSMRNLFSSLKRYLYEGYQFGDEVIPGKPRGLGRRIMTEEVLKNTRDRDYEK